MYMYTYIYMYILIYTDIPEICNCRNGLTIGVGDKPLLQFCCSESGSKALHTHRIPHDNGGRCGAHVHAPAE